MGCIQTSSTNDKCFYLPIGPGGPGGPRSPGSPYFIPDDDDDENTIFK